MNSSGDSRNQHLLDSAWRAVSSMRLALWLLFGVLLCIALATLLPQMPPGLSDAARTEWIALASRRLGGLYPVLSSSGLLDVYYSPAFGFLVSILLLNTTACTLDRARTLTHQAYRGHLAPLGSLITHIAVILLVLSVATSQSSSWEHTTAPVAEGQTYTIEDRPGWTVRNDGLRLLFDEQQRVVDYSARASLLHNGQTVRQGEIKPNAPLRISRLGAWMMSYEPGVAVQVRDRQEQALLVQHAGGQSASGQMTVTFGSGQAAFTVPGAHLELLISSPQSVLADRGFDLTVRRLSTGELLLSKEALLGTETDVAGLLVTLETSPYAIYRVKHDPAAPALLITALALVLGTSLSLFAAKRHPS